MKRAFIIFGLLLPNALFSSQNKIYNTYTDDYINTTSTKASDYYKVNEAFSYLKSDGTIGWTTDISKKQSYIDINQYINNLKQQNEKLTQSKSNQYRFYIEPSYSMQWADFKFDMNSAGSIVSWDDFSWNVFSIDSGYNFSGTLMGGTPILKLGYSYGSMTGDGRGIDDDMTNGGFVEYFPTCSSCSDNLQAVDVSTISVGKMSGKFNDIYISFGLSNILNGKTWSVVPTAGYRYFKHDMKIKDSIKNTIYTKHAENGPQYFDGNPTDGYYTVDVPGYSLDSYILYSGLTHDYETTWQGPFVSLNIMKSFNDGDFLNANIEFGLPKYSAEGYWPYRTYEDDNCNGNLKKPGFKDNGSIGNAYHIGFDLKYNTKIASSTFLTFGANLDYYSLKDGTTKTLYDPRAYAYTDTDNNTSYVYPCADGFICTIDNELNSVYKSIGLNIGLLFQF